MPVGRVKTKKIRIHYFEGVFTRLNTSPQTLLQTRSAAFSLKNIFVFLVQFFIYSFAPAMVPDFGRDEKGTR